jgi:hypothetical protein
MNTKNNRRRDWGLIIFILPIGIILMLLSGQVAIRIIPFWVVNGGMFSNLDPENPSGQQAEIAPISIDILTPMSWFDTFLTPGPGSDDTVFFPPLVIFEPTGTPSPTVSVTPSASPTGTPVTPTGTPSTPTPKPTKEDDDPTPVPVCTDPAADNYLGALPCTYPPVCTDPTADNYLGPLPCTYPPPTTCTDSAANNNGGPLPCIYPTPSVLVGGSTPVPGNINVGNPNNTIGIVLDGYYIIIDLGSPLLEVTGPSDTNADLVYYEQVSGPGIQMDQVIISISMDGAIYYVVFNWGDGDADTNSNIGDVAGSEADNQPINASELYDPDGPGSAPDTGVLINVDGADSNPPPGLYQYIAIQAPDLPGNADIDVAFDAVDVVDTPIPP